ncbi:MAG: hypothetical protein IPK83_04760 [Planctomycetes bacterium]|nr:hypothetical protein [Planctomycetota bacterium]
MTYDYMGRRVRKLVLELVDGEGPPTGSNPWGGNDGEVVDDMRYIYDGWNMVMERDASGSPLGTTETVRNKYAWGCDLAGLNGGAATGDVQSSIHGAGGIGGLLAMEYTAMPDCTEPPKLFYAYDGNGNVGQMVFFDAGDCPMRAYDEGYVSAKYEYDPYGGTLLAVNNYGIDNPFRFSTKFYDAQPSTAAAGERGLYYYGYRYYSPRLGRWVNRDPREELGGLNLHSFVANSIPNLVDPNGLTPQSIKVWEGIRVEKGDLATSCANTQFTSTLTLHMLAYRKERWPWQNGLIQGPSDIIVGEN